MKADHFDLAPAMLAAFSAQALQRPRAEALRVLRHGAWRRLSWSELAVRAGHAARGWATLGVGRGDTIVAVGALGESFILTLIAVQLLGARIKVEADASLDRAIADACFVLAQDTLEVDRVLMHRSASLRALVIENEFGAEPSADVVTLGWDGLIEAGAAQPTRSLDSDTDVGANTNTLSLVQSGPLQGGPNRTGAAWRTVLADFPLCWLPGLRWLMGSWPAIGATLVVADAGGEAGAALIDVRPELWITSAQTLAAFDASARGRVPAAGGLGARAVHAALAKGSGPLQAAMRWRLRQVLGLGSVQAVLTEPQTVPAAVALLQRLGVAVDSDLPQPAEMTRPRIPVSAHGSVERFKPATERAAP
jgi:hypothetical protein